MFFLLNTQLVFSQIRVEKFDMEKDYSILIDANNLYFESLLENALEDYGFNIIYDYDDSNLKVYELILYGQKRSAVRCGGNIILELNGRLIDLSNNKKLGSFYFSQDLFGAICPLIVADRIAEKLSRNRN